MFNPHEREAMELRTAREMLITTIVENGEVSPNGLALRVEPLNRVIEPGLIELVDRSMASWVRTTVNDIDKRTTRVGVVGGSGDALAVRVAVELGLVSVVFTEGRLDTMFGPVLSRIISSPRRRKPTTISVETMELRGREIIMVDDFIRGGTTIKTANQMVEEAGGQVVAVCAAVARSSARSLSFLQRCPFLAVVEIEEIIPHRGDEPAQVKFAGMLGYQTLNRRWEPS